MLFLNHVPSGVSQNQQSYGHSRNLASEDKVRDKKQSNTTAIGWMKPGFIQEWKEFNFECLEQCMAARYKTALAHQSNISPDHSLISRFRFCEIQNESSVEDLLMKWKQSIVCDALMVAQDVLQTSEAHDSFYMARGGQTLYANLGPRIAPDWAGRDEARLGAPFRKTSCPGILN